MKPFGLQRGVVGSTARHKTNSQYYREQMLKYEDDIERLQAEVEKAREGRSKILSFFGTRELAEAKKQLSDKDKQIEMLQQRISQFSNIPSLRIRTQVKNETFEDAKYFEWYNPVIQKYLNSELTEHELVNEIFEPFEQVSQVQAQLLGATFEMLSGGPAQTHVGTGGGGSSSDMPWGEKKNDNYMTASRRKR